MTKELAYWRMPKHEPYQRKRPDIAQAIHDAAVNDKAAFLDVVVFTILLDAFATILDWSVAAAHPNGFDGWLRTDEGRTYMLLVAEALS